MAGGTSGSRSGSGSASTVGYLGVRSVVDRNPAKAIVNGFRVIDFEQRLTHHLFEQTAQRIADSSHLLLTAAAWTYWNSEFTVIGLTLLWVYLRRHERFARFRNTILLANMIGLVGYVARADRAAVDVPARTASWTASTTRAALGALANPYAAMPSLHAADALIVGIFLVRACRRRWSSKPSGRSGPPGSGSACSRRPTTSGSTCSPGSWSRSSRSRSSPGAARAPFAGRHACAQAEPIANLL